MNSRWLLVVCALFVTLSAAGDIFDGPAGRRLLSMRNEPWALLLLSTDESDPNDFYIYCFHRERTKQVAKGIYQTWIRYDVPRQESKAGEKTAMFDHKIMKRSIDCNGFRVLTTAVYLYDGSHTTDSVEDDSQDWEDVVPGSIGEEYVKKFCAQQQEP